MVPSSTEGRQKHCISLYQDNDTPKENTPTMISDYCHKRLEPKYTRPFSRNERNLRLLDVLLCQYRPTAYRGDLHAPE